MLLERFRTDDDSEYRKAIDGRSGNWSEAQEERAETFNELARINHTLHWAHTNPEQFVDYDPPRFISPVERQEWSAEDDEDDEGDRTDDEFYDDME